MAITKFNTTLHRLRHPMPARFHPPAAILAQFQKVHGNAPAAKPAPAATKPAAKKPSTRAKRK